MCVCTNITKAHHQIHKAFPLMLKHRATISVTCTTGAEPLRPGWLCRPARPPPRLADGRFDIIGSLPPDTRIGQPVPEGGVTHEALGMRSGVSNRQNIGKAMMAEQL